MLLFICLAIFVGGIICGCVWEYEEWPIFPIVLGAFATIICLVVLGVNHIGVDAYIERLNVRHDMLVYQYENDIYDNDNDIGKRELMVDIQDWNEDLAARKERQDDFWVGIFIPNIYDQFEFIELE